MSFQNLQLYRTTIELGKYYIMHTVSYYIGISKQTEVLFLVLAGICCTIFDASLFNLHTNLYKVWNMPMDPTKFTDTAQMCVKYILSSIVLVRTFTVHLYLAFYIVMLWPAIFEEKAGLLIPWLIVGAVKCLAMGAMSFSTGLYICLTYRFSKAVCWDFLMTQVIDQGPSIYMWFCILSYYYDIRKKVPDTTYRIDRQTPSTVFSLAERRRRVRSLFADPKLQHTFDDDRQLISVSTIDNIINQLNINLHRDATRSLDSLLCKLAAEAEKDEILDVKDDLIDEDKNLSIAEKTLKVLNISPSYVSDAKMRKDAKLIKSHKGPNLKVQSSPLLLQKSGADSLKTKKLVLKLESKKSDELSLILSETEINAVRLNDNKESNTPMGKVQQNETFIDIDHSSKVQNTYETQNEMQDLELKEIHISSFDDNISEISKLEYVDTEISHNFPITDNALEESERDKKVEENEIVAPLTPPPLQEILKGTKEANNNTQNLEAKPKVNHKAVSTIRAKSPKPLPKTLKSKSMSINTSLPPSSFKHDGYTLAYIESQQRKAAAEIIRNKGRPNSSGI